MAIEALLDNEESSILLDTMKQIEWPADSEFYGLRIFLAHFPHISPALWRDFHGVSIRY